MRKVDSIIFLLIAFNLILSIYLIASSPEFGFCIIGTSCLSVQNSEYGKIAGISVSWIGVFAFSYLFIVKFLSKNNLKFKRLFLAASLLGAIISLWFLYAQFIILKSLCSTCLIIDITMIIIFSLAFYDSIKGKITNIKIFQAAFV